MLFRKKKFSCCADASHFSADKGKLELLVDSDTCNTRPYNACFSDFIYPEKLGILGTNTHVNLFRPSESLDHQ